jgi:hypothetical protein
MEENKVGVQEIETSVVKPKMSLFVNSVENRLLSTEDESKLDKLLSDVSEFMEKNSGRGKPKKKRIIYIYLHRLFGMNMQIC